jgi:hypothetical protein
MADYGLTGDLQSEEEDKAVKEFSRSQESGPILMREDPGGTKRKQRRAAASMRTSSKQKRM